MSKLQQVPMGFECEINNKAFQSLIANVPHYKNIDDYIQAMRSSNPELKWYTLARLYKAFKLQQPYSKVRF
jgi:hypothetical protein